MGRFIWKVVIGTHSNNALSEILKGILVQYFCLILIYKTYKFKIKDLKILSYYNTINIIRKQSVPPEEFTVHLTTIQAYVMYNKMAFSA